LTPPPGTGKYSAVLVIYGLSTAFTIAMAVHAVKHGRAGSWLWIILFFGPIGSAIYLFSEVLDVPNPFAYHGPRRATARDAARAEAEARRLDTAGAWSAAATLHRQRAEFTSAVSAARRAVEKGPRDPEARYELGMGLLGSQHATEAAEVLAAVVQHDPKYAGGDALWGLARAQEMAEDFAGARRSLEMLMHQSERPEVLFELASVQARLGDVEAARHNLNRIIEEAQLVPDYLQRSVRPWVKKAEKAQKVLSGGSR
jgi:hypothetical protein